MTKSSKELLCGGDIRKSWVGSKVGFGKTWGGVQTERVVGANASCGRDSKDSEEWEGGTLSRDLPPVSSQGGRKQGPHGCLWLLCAKTCDPRASLVQFRGSIVL